MYIAKLVLFIAALGISTTSAAPTPGRTYQDFRKIASLSTDVSRAVERLPINGYDAFSVHDLFTATEHLVRGISKINKVNADAEAEDFDKQQNGDICRRLHRTRYMEANLIKQLGDNAERISQFPLTPEIGKLLDQYDEEMTRLLDEINSRLDDCSDEYKQRLEDAIKKATAQYAATEPKA